MTKHAVVVGGGIMGLSVADELLNRGLKVTLLDRDEREGEACSYGNGGLIVPSHFVPLAAPGMVRTGLKMLLDRRSPFGIQSLLDPLTLGWLARFAASCTREHAEACAPVLRDLNLASREIYFRKAKEMGLLIGLENRGVMVLCRRQETLDSEAHLAEQGRALGLDVTVHTKSSLDKLEPGVQMAVAGGVHFAEDCHFTPPPYLAALRESISDRGAAILAGTAAEGLVVRDGAVAGVQTSGGVVEGDEFVLAAGAWSGELAATAGLKLQMRAGRGYGFTSPRLPQKVTIPTILAEARIAVTPMLTGTRFVGTLEVSPPELRSSSPRVEGMKENIASFYPAFKRELLDAPVWCGLRPCTPDGMPYLGRTSRVGRLVVCTGHAMMGLSLGPISGVLAAQAVCGEPSSIPLDLLSPDRHP